jgi:hypothetical protein
MKFTDKKSDNFPKFGGSKLNTVQVGYIMQTDEIKYTIYTAQLLK